MDASKYLVRKYPLGLTCLLILSAGSAANALELQSDVSAGVGRSDNIARTPDDPIEETVGLVGFNLGLTEETSRIDADIRLQADYVHYADDTFDNEVVGGLAGTVDLTLLEERLNWLFQENYGQQAIDPLTPANPGNRENVSFFTTGPTLRLLPASRNFIQADLRYSSVNYEVRLTDNERMSASLSIGRQTSRDAEISLVASRTEVDYKDELSTDFDRNEGFVRYAVSGGRNILNVDVGVTEVDVAGEKGDGTLLRLSWTRQISTDKTFVLSGGSNYSDQGDIFRFNQRSSSDLRETEDVIGSAEPFTNNFAFLSYSIDRERTSLSFGLNWNQEDYEGESNADRQTYGASFQVRRDLTERTFAALNLQYREREFENLVSTDENLTVSAEFGLRFSPSSRIALQYAHFERSGDTAFVEVEENRLFLRFFYTPAWGR